MKNIIVVAVIYSIIVGSAYLISHYIFICPQ